MNKDGIVSHTQLVLVRGADISMDYCVGRVGVMVQLCTSNGECTEAGRTG